MSALETLALMCPHGSTGIGGRGGKDRITAQDVAAAVAMAGLESGPELLVLVRYADQADLYPRLQTQVYLETIGLANRNRWTIERGVQRVRWLSQIALGEHLQPPLCVACNGTGVHKNQKTCATCEGTGRVQLRRGQDYAEALQITLADWQNIWEPRYRVARAMLDVWESDAERAIGRALR